MAQLHSDFIFTGSLGNISAYKMRGVDKIILRTKGGASKSKIKNSPVFANTRRVNMEFGGRAKTSRWVLQALTPLRLVSDYSLSGKINALLKPAQEMDTASEFGKRHVALSMQPRLLEGLNLNRRNLFEAVVTNPVHYTLSKDAHQASVDIPALRPGINFIAPGNFSLYRLKVVLAVIPDVLYINKGYKPNDPYYYGSWRNTIETNWFAVAEGAAAIKLDLSLDIAPPNDAFSLMLGIGLEFGSTRNNTVEPIKYMGCAKILAMA